MEFLKFQAIFGMIVIVLFLGLSVVSVINDKRQHESGERLNLTYDEVMNILNERIREEFRYKYLLEYRLKDVRVIYDIKADTKELTLHVYESFSTEFIKDLERYHTKQYIIRVITREVEILLFEYTDQKKISSK